MLCDGCGAPFDDSHPRCPFCGRLNAQANAAREERSEAEARRLASEDNAEAARLRGQASTTVQRCARHSLYWALGGLPFCMVPVGGVVGIVMALRAKSLARAHGLIAPAKATVGLVIASLQLVLGLAAIGGVTWLEQTTEARRETLREALAGQLESPTLTQPIACKLVELHLLMEGHDGSGGANINDYRCPGKLELHGETALLRGVRFSRRRCDVTLAFGRAWSVESLSGPTCYRSKQAAQTEAEAGSED